MRIAIVSTLAGHQWGGSEELWFRTAMHLRNQGVVIHVSVTHTVAKSPHIRELRAAGCDIELSTPKPLLERILRRASLISDWKRDWLDRFRPDLVVHSLPGHGSPGYESALPDMEACAHRGVRYVVIIQAAFDNPWPPDVDLERIERCYRNAARCYFVSDNNRRLVESQIGPLANGAVIRNPFSVSYDARPSWPDQNMGVYLACVARLDGGVKGHDLIIEVLGMPKWRERDIKVSLFGSGNNERSLRQLAERHNLTNVEFRGFTRDVQSIWSTHHALLLPSRAEGLPIAVVEAMLCGRPCIVTNVAGNAELLRDGETGFVAPAPTVELLDATLERAYSRRADWKRMGDLAAKEVRQKIPARPEVVFAEELNGILNSLGNFKRHGSRPVI
jgi:glycosyltransferase involved in cell wall biosynthesis